MGAALCSVFQGLQGQVGEKLKARLTPPGLRCPRSMLESGWRLLAEAAVRLAVFFLESLNSCNLVPVGALHLEIKVRLPSLPL